jgi:tRNA threonylcarbamoyladenosine biosynthesis protein TsaB
MMTLAIDTASTQTSIALLDGDKLLKENVWLSEQNEAEKLMPEILKLVPALEELKKIIVVNGPGSFTGLRVGVAVANTLAYLLGTELYGTGTFETWHARYDGDATLLIKAGKKEVFENNEIKPIDEIKPQKVFGDLMQKQISTLKENGIEFVQDSQIKTFGQAVATLQNLKKVNIVEPNYKRGPKITISKDKWKNPRHAK